MDKINVSSTNIVVHELWNCFVPRVLGCPTPAQIVRFYGTDEVRSVSDTIDSVVAKESMQLRGCGSKRDPRDTVSKLYAHRHESMLWTIAQQLGAYPVEEP